MKLPAALLLLLTTLPAFGQSLIPTTKLSDVHKIYAHGPNWQPLLLEYRSQKIDGRKMQVPEGDCVGGYKTRIPGLVYVCDRANADAEIIASGSVNQANWSHADNNQRINCSSNSLGSDTNTACTSTGGSVRTGTETVANMTVNLVSMRTGQTLWSGSADNRAGFGRAFALGAGQSGATHVGGVEQAAMRIVKQLEHDYKASEKSR
jgi:hypothetical protein